jgi:DNA-binding FadR family transcriptional regulator
LRLPEFGERHLASRRDRESRNRISDFFFVALENVSNNPVMSQIIEAMDPEFSKRTQGGAESRYEMLSFSSMSVGKA